MSSWINIALDLTLIVLVASGLVQATRLIRHLAGLRQGRMEMEQFVREFNGTVLRAEAGIRSLRQAARESGDDLEKLVEKALLVRDELQFIVDRADQISTRMSNERAPAVVAESEAKPAATSSNETVTPFAAKKTGPTPSASAASRAERELMQALEKLG